MKKEYLFLFLSALFFGSIHPIGKLLMTEITPLQFTLIRTSFAFLILSIGLLFSGEWKIIRKMKRDDVYICIILGIISFFLFQVLLSLALTKIPAAINSVLINSTIPISVLALTGIISHKKITKYSVFGVILGMLGMSLVVLKPEDLSLINMVGVAFALIAGLFWGINTFLITRVRKKYGTLPVLSISILSGAIVSFVFTLLLDGCSQLANASFNTKLLFLSYSLCC